MSMILETKRLILRNFIRSDVAKYALIHDALAGPGVAQAGSAAAGAEELARGYIAAADCQPRLDYHLAILERRDGKLIGSCGICLHGPRARTAVLNCEVVNDWRSQGYGYEAAEAVLNVAFRDLGVHYVSAEVSPRNAAAIRLASRLGLAAVNPEPDNETDMIMGIKASDWLSPAS